MYLNTRAELAVEFVTKNEVTAHGTDVRVPIQPLRMTSFKTWVTMNDIESAECIQTDTSRMLIDATAR